MFTKGRESHNVSAQRAGSRARRSRCNNPGGWSGCALVVCARRDGRRNRDRVAGPNCHISTERANSGNTLRQVTCLRTVLGPNGG